MADQNPKPDAPAFPTSVPIDRLIAEPESIESDQRAAIERAEPQIRQVSPHFRRSATNLVQYLAFRGHDVRPVQDALAELGLSSLGRAEAHIRTTIASVLVLFYRLAERTPEPAADQEPPVRFREGAALLAAHTEALLGPPPDTRRAGSWS